MKELRYFFKHWFYMWNSTNKLHFCIMELITRATPGKSLVSNKKAGLTIGRKINLDNLNEITIWNDCRDPEATKIEADLELEETWSKDRFWHGEEIAKVQTRWRMSPGYMHSFSVTDNYYVLIEQPLCINIPKMARSLLSRLVKMA